MAKATIERLSEDINQHQATELQIYNPSTNGNIPMITRTYWWLIVFPYGGDTIKPNQCLNQNWKNCICICSYSRINYLIISATNWFKC